MPATWSQIARELKYGLVDRSAVEPAIFGGAYYMAKLRASWTAKRPEDDRHRLAQASYNAGLGNILAAQKACNGAVLYFQIIPCLPQITGNRNAHETVTYVQRIWKWWQMMEAGL